ncbi:MAG: helix-turn-helix domain-containing protein [Bacillota bacterium]
MIQQAQPFFNKCTSRYEEYFGPKQNDYYLFQFNISDDTCAEIFAIPDGYIDIFIDLTAKSTFDAKIYGFIKNKHITDLIPGHEYFGIRLHPSYAIAFFDSPLKDTCEQVVDLQCLAKDRLEIFKRMTEKRTFMERAAYINKAFGPILYNEKKYSLLVDWILSQLRYSKGNIKIKSLVYQSGYSDVYIRRIFKEHIGLSCKMYSDIVRFQSAIQKLNQEGESDFFAIIEGLGYYDQSHFIHELKRFSGYTPRSLQEKLRNSG